MKAWRKKWMKLNVEREREPVLMLKKSSIAQKICLMKKRRVGDLWPQSAFSRRKNEEVL
jgi:hypothetical protein